MSEQECEDAPCDACEDEVMCDLCGDTLPRLRWTRERPTEPGWYYVHFGGERGMEMAEVREASHYSGRMLDVWVTSEADYCSYPVSDFAPSVLWCRLPEPPEVPR